MGQRASICLASLLALALMGCANHELRELDAAEALLADYLDAAGAVDLIDSGVATTFDGMSAQEWTARYSHSEQALSAALDGIEPAGFSKQDLRRLASMRGALALRAVGAAGAPPRCEDVSRIETDGAQLRAALYACFGEAGEAIHFRGETIGRIDALGLIETLATSRERRAVFDAMGPLYRAVNGERGELSPYRRMISLERTRMRANIDAAVQSLGLNAAEGEAWLVRALEAWEATLPYAHAEPWDFRLAMTGAIDPTLASCASRTVQLEGNARFYGDLGADLDALGVVIDTNSNAPVAYADFARVGRFVDGRWRAAIPWTTLVVADGGPDGAAELVHEVGHTIHYAAMRARPSLLLPDDLSLLVESVAELTGWSVSEPAWQRKYVGCAVEGDAALRAKLAPIMMDVAWGLFEMRMARAPESDPNIVWGEITERYFRVRRHDDVAWWAVRGQLVEEPGYMVNYALGAFVTADLRARIGDEIGDFDTGNPRWYAYVSTHLFERGGEDTPRELLRSFLGRDVTPQAFLAEVARLERD